MALVNFNNSNISDIPLVSLVVPTTGKLTNLTRCLNSVIYSAKPLLLRNIELIIFVNIDPKTPVNLKNIENFTGGLQEVFYSVRIIVANKFYLTAEESALAAIEYASGKYLWISGDKRVFLPEGLTRLETFVTEGHEPCAYFNSTWVDNTGRTSGYQSTYFSSSSCLVSYKEFVMSNGANYMATTMGAWVFERQYLNPEIWMDIIATCGPHFSHVTVLLLTLKDVNVRCFSSYLFQAEFKAYHTGDDSEWARYATLSDTYRFYAWTFGLVRQFNYLIKAEIYTYADVRRSMCSERSLLKRQVDEIYAHFLAQIRFGWVKKEEVITKTEFEEIMYFLFKSCPEKVILNTLIVQVYEASLESGSSKFCDLFDKAMLSINIDAAAPFFSTLLVCQVGGEYIRLHPKGYVVSSVRDNKEFLMPYKLIDAPKSGSTWQVLTEDEFYSYNNKSCPKVISGLFPNSHAKTVRKSLINRIKYRVVIRVYRYRLAAIIISRLPSSIKHYLKSILM